MAIFPFVTSPENREGNILSQMGWRKLLFLDHFDLELEVNIIIVACVLQNVCILNDDFDDGYFLDDDDDGDGGIDDGHSAGVPGAPAAAEAKRVQLMNIVC